MTNMKNSHLQTSGATRQRGIVLFFALIALVAMSLAAVALIRSVDTATLVAGNLAFKQSTINSADIGIEAAASLLEARQRLSNLNVLRDPKHPFNVTCLAIRPAATANPTDPGCPAIVPGYHSSINPALNLFDDATWNDTNSILVGPNASGNTIRYIIQRVCHRPNLPVQQAGCLFGGNIATDDNGQEVKNPQQICEGSSCPRAGQSPQNRITARVEGLRNTTSYIQAFAY